MRFKQRCSNFVEWFAKNQNELELIISQGKYKDATDLIHVALEECFVGLSIVLYENNKKYVLEFESVLNNSKKIVSFFLCQSLRKLKLKKWNFVHYHPALDVGLTYDKSHISSKMIDIIPTEKDGHINITVIKNSFLNQFNSDQQYSIVYMLMIDALGEFYFEQKVGKMAIVPNIFIRNKNKLSLYEFAKQKKIKKEVEQGLLSEKYSFKSDSEEKRLDIIEGITYDIEYLNQEINNTFSPSRIFFEDNGICVISYVFENANQDNQKSFKEVEKKLEGLFRTETQGFIMNWANGNKYSYLDCLIFSDESIDEITKIASEHAIEITGL